MELSDLIGRKLSALGVEGAPYQWVFSFPDECFVNVECDWRIVHHSRVLIAAKDHERVFGSDKPVDVADEVLSILGGRSVVDARIETAGDVRVEFEGGIRLETFTDSSAYESCTINLLNQRLLVVIGGGEIVEFPGYA